MQGQLQLSDPFFAEAAPCVAHLGTKDYQELRTAEAKALVISPSSEMVCLFGSGFGLPAHTEVQFFPDQELLGAEERQCAARGTDFTQY